MLEALEASGQYRYSEPALGSNSDADWQIAAYKTACLKHFPLAMAFWPGERTANTLGGADVAPPSKASEYLVTCTLSADASRVPLSGLCPPGKFGLPHHAKHGIAELPLKSPADAVASATGGLAEEFGPPEPASALASAPARAGTGGALAADLAHLQLSEPATAQTPAPK